MKKFFVLTCLTIALAVAGVLAQGVPAPYTMRLQTAWPTGVFSRPILIRGANDGSRRLFVVQQTGLIRVIQPNGTISNFIDLSSRILVPVSAGDERGLLGLTFHPQFATNGRFFVYYTRAGDNATVVAEYTTTSGNGNSNTGDFNSQRILFTIAQPFSNHNGGMMDFGLDGFLYIGTGDGGSANDPGARSQNRATMLGKMLRIDPNVPQGSQVQYLIPPSNPFTGANTTRCDTGTTTAGNTCQEIYSIGLRNPWRWTFDRQTGQMWIGDVGQNAIEEVNIGASGANFGWRVYEGTTCTGLDAGLCTPSNFTMPVFQYSHTGGRCSITGGYAYRGGQRQLPNGNYVYADYCTGEIWRWDGASQILIQDTPRLIVSFGQDDDGELYVCYSNGQIDKITRARASADFDGDFRTDLSVFRPSSGTWFITNSSNSTFRGQNFGISTDVPTPEDYDGDNISDIAVFRPSEGVWYRLLSATNTFAITQFGSNGDIPAAGDYDGDGRADLTVFRPSNGVWYIFNSANSSVTIRQFGLNGDRPTAGDFDGDGRYDIALWRPSDGVWYRLDSASDTFRATRFGLNGDIPVPGDFDGDVRSDIAVFRPSDGVWYRLNSSNGTFSATNWGLNGDIPAVGDYDGDGRDDVAVFRPSDGVWYLNRSTAGTFILQFGLNGDLPAPAYDTH